MLQNRLLTSCVYNKGRPTIIRHGSVQLRQAQTSTIYWECVSITSTMFHHFPQCFTTSLGCFTTCQRCFKISDHVSPHPDTVAYFGFYKLEGKFSLATNAFTEGAKLCFQTFTMAKTDFVARGHCPMPTRYATAQQYFNTSNDVSPYPQCFTTSAMFHHIRNVSPHPQCFTTSAMFHHIRNISPHPQCFTTSAMFHHIRNISPHPRCFTTSAMFHQIRNVSPNPQCFTKSASPRRFFARIQTQVLQSCSRVSSSL